MCSRIDRAVRTLVVAAVLAASWQAGAHAESKPSPAASAKNKARAKAHVAEANAAFKAEDYEAALVGYTRAYEEYPVPALLFNIAQCHRHLKHYDLALEAYDGFVLYGAPSDADRAAVADLVAQVKRDRDAARAANKPLVVQPVEPAPAANPVVVTTSAPATEERPIYKRWWFWTAVGSAALIAGGAYYMSQGSSEPATGSIGKLDWR